MLIYHGYCSHVFCRLSTINSPCWIYSKMLSNTLLLFLSLGFYFSAVFAALDPNGVPYPNDTSVLKHQADQARLIAYEKKERNGTLSSNALSLV
jgi:hypothetical protein